MADDDSKPPARPSKRPIDDRDVLKRKTPPKGVAEQIGHKPSDAAPRDPMSTGESMPIVFESPQDAIIEFAKRARTISKDLHVQAEAVKELKQQQNLHTTELNTLKVEQKTTGDTVREVASDVGKMRIEFAEVRGMSTVIKDDVAAIKRIAEHEKKVLVDDKADEKKTRRAIWVKAMAIIGGIATAIATAITALASKGC